jgi:2',3'-cyclic-nucleotide 2'-phosphodiesterase / 3'-nucleotidase / 5'-nucleotidase
MLTTLLALLSLAPQGAPSQDTVQIVVVATTDVHGRAVAWDYVTDSTAPYGLTRVATMVETLRAQYPGRVVLVDAGDLLQGNAFAAYWANREEQPLHPIVDAMNVIQYDAVTPGNHDFDFGVATLGRSIRSAGFRYVSANVLTIPGDAPAFETSTTLERAGVKVGITGFTTPGVMVWDRAQLAGQRRVVPPEAVAGRVLTQLDQAGADLKIVLIHSGMGGESSYDTTGVGAEDVAARLAAITPKPDLVVVGHSHRQMTDSVINGVHFIQARPWAQGLAVARVTLARGSGEQAGRWRVVRVQAQDVPLANVPEQQRLARRLADPHEKVRLWTAEVLGDAVGALDARYGRAEDTPFADFVAEVMRRKAGTQLAATAVFDPEVSLGPGQIQRRHLFGAYPYENTLRAVKVSGAQLRAFLEHSARYFYNYFPGRQIVNTAVPGYNFDVVNGAEYNIDLSQSPGRRIRGLRVSGRPVADADSFTLALSSYRQEGGGGYSMLRGAPVIYDKGENIRDLLAAEIQRAGTLGPRDYFTANWAIVPREAQLAVRTTFMSRSARIGPPRDTVLLRVLATTDVHGALLPQTYPWSGGRPVGGAAALKAWMDSMAAECGCPTLRLDGGDQMQGTPISNWTGGRSTIEAFNAMGLDAAAIGNHEFDWTVDSFAIRKTQARYRWLAANITEAAGGARPAWAEPWAMLTAGPRKVAVIGLITTETPTATRPTNVAHLRFGPGAAAVRAVLPEVRAASPDFVIVVAHAGASCDSAGTTCRGEIMDVARGLDSTSVQLIVAGHTHRPVSGAFNGIPIIQARSNGTAIGVVDFVKTAAGARVVRQRLETVWADSPRPDPAMTALLEPYRQDTDSQARRPVARLRGALRRGGGEFPLGRLIADAERAAARADVAIINNGGIRADLDSGSVTYGALFSVQPFQNTVMRLEVKGDVLLAALEQAVAGSSPDANISGIEVWYDPRRASGRRIMRTQLAGGRGIEVGRTYTLAVLDFLHVGGSGFSMLVGQPGQSARVTDLEALINHLRRMRQPVEAPTDERLHSLAR